MAHDLADMGLLATAGADHREDAMTSIQVTEDVIDVPEWMDHQYTYTVYWSLLTGEWTVVPF